jgi:hypothetical protein
MDPRRELTADERHAIVRHVDRILGIDQYEHDFENQVPSLGIIRLDKGKVKPDAPDKNPNPQIRDPKVIRTPNSEGGSTAENAELAETI